MKIFRKAYREVESLSVVSVLVIKPMLVRKFHLLSQILPIGMDIALSFSGIREFANLLSYW